jgi:hypothetical protein
VNIEGIIDYILKAGNAYPGCHSRPTERTSPSQPPLEPKAQMMIIWRALVTYLDTKLRAGQGVYVKNFGAFTFDIKTDLP